MDDGGIEALAWEALLLFALGYLGYVAGAWVGAL